jgi:hypothetical protein
MRPDKRGYKNLLATFFERKDIVLSFVLTQKERTKEKVKTEEKYE